MPVVPTTQLTPAPRSGGGQGGRSVMPIQLPAGAGTVPPSRGAPGMGGLPGPGGGIGRGIASAGKSIADKIEQRRAERRKLDFGEMEAMMTTLTQSGSKYLEAEYLAEESSFDDLWRGVELRVEAGDLPGAKAAASVLTSPETQMMRLDAAKRRTSMEADFRMDAQKEYWGAMRDYRDGVPFSEIQERLYAYNPTALETFNPDWGEDPETGKVPVERAMAGMSAMATFGIVGGVASSISKNVETAHESFRMTAAMEEDALFKLQMTRDNSFLLLNATTAENAVFNAGKMVPGIIDALEAGFDPTAYSNPYEMYRDLFKELGFLRFSEVSGDLGKEYFKALEVGQWDRTSMDDRVPATMLAMGVLGGYLQDIARGSGVRTFHVFKAEQIGSDEDVEVKFTTEAGELIERVHGNPETLRKFADLSFMAIYIEGSLSKTNSYVGHLAKQVITQSLGPLVEEWRALERDKERSLSQAEVDALFHAHTEKFGDLPSMVPIIKGLQRNHMNRPGFYKRHEKAVPPKRGSRERPEGTTPAAPLPGPLQPTGPMRGPM